MRRLTLVLIVLAAAVAVGQYIETYIPLPDSFGSLYGYGYRNWLVYDEALGKVFYGVEYSELLLVFDAATGDRVGRIDLGGWLLSKPGLSPREHKLYCGVYDPTSGVEDLRVYDCASGALLRRISTNDSTVTDVAYNPGANKLYVELDWRRVFVVDCAGDSVVARIDLPRGLSSVNTLLFVPGANKLYVPRRDSLAVIDGTSDSIVDWVILGMTDVKLTTWNPVTNSVWCFENDPSTALVAVVDCAADSVVALRQTGVGAVVEAECDSVGRWVFCLSGSPELLCRFDAQTAELDSFIGLGEPFTLVVSSAAGRVYAGDEYGTWVFRASSMERACLTNRTEALDIVPVLDGVAVLAVGEWDLAVVDGEGDSLLRTVPTGWAFTPECYNPADGRVYGTEWCGEYSMLAFDGASLQLAGGWHLDAGSPFACCSLTNRLLMKASSGSDSLKVFDCAAESIVASLCYGKPVFHDAVNHRLYCTYYTDLLSYDCRSLLELRRTPLPSSMRAVAGDDSGGRLYYESGGILRALDLADDSLLWECSVGQYVGSLRYLRGVNRLGVLVNRTVLLVDCIDGSVDSAIPLPLVRPGGTAYSPACNKLYVTSGDSLLAVIDCSGLRLLDTIRFDGVTGDPLIDEVRDRLYLRVDWPQRSLAVLDCRSDSVIAVLVPDRRMMGYPMVVDWQHGRCFSTSGSEGGITVIRDSTPTGAWERGLSRGASRATPGPTVVRGVLRLPGLGTRSELPGNSVMSRAVLLDACGRKVMDLKAGDNDVSRLAPGIYFVRGWGPGTRGEGSGVTKVIVTQ